jgi:hypothetical protein
MGVFDFFKKKKDEPDFKSLGLDIDSSPNPADTTGMNPGMGMNPMDTSSNSFNAVNLSTMGMNAQQYPQSGNVEKDMQILSLKLDAIKSELDNISQRLRNIETIAEKEQQQTQQKQQRWF